MNKIRYIVTSLVFCIIVGGFSAWLLIKSPDEISEWERRPLAQFPEVSYDALMDREFMDGFESYVNEQFPLRNTFRRIKAMVLFNVFNQMDNNGIYIAEGHASKFDGEITQEQLDTFTDRISSLYDRFIEGSECNVYYAIIPDKNYFLAESHGYPSFDYDKLYSGVNETLGSDMTEIEIRDILTVDDYYTTDTHWRQEEIVDVANYIREQMGMEEVSGYTQQSAGDFYGVYYGQSALSLPPDEIIYLNNEQIEASTLYLANDQGKLVEADFYDLEMLNDMDHYNIYLSGARKPLVKIVNPMGKEDKKLVVFRDSYGSSLVPLLISDYSEITVIDTRDLNPAMIPYFVKFTNQDVLFIYSTLVVEQSTDLLK